MTISKETAGRKPLTVCSITAGGRKRYFEYLAVLEQVIVDAAGTAKAARAKGLRHAQGT